MSNGIQLASKGRAAITKLEDTLKAAAPSFAAVLPKYLTPERLIKVALVACGKNPKLLACTTQSVVSCVMLGAELGLEAGSPLGHLYLVPYGEECTPIIGYTGLVELAWRSGKLLDVGAWVVHEKDAYEVKFGRELVLWHTPYMAGDPGKAIFTYAVAHLKGGGTQAVVMSIADVEKIRARSRAKGGPWTTDYEEMVKKSALRRLCKLLPKSTRMIRAMSEEEDSYSSPQLVAGEPEAPKSRTEEVKDQLLGDPGSPTDDEMAEYKNDNADGVQR